MRRLLRTFQVCALALLPAVAGAQSATTGAIAGSVKDATGAVLPGVTVEASSPALIEKVRTVVTGGDGNYRIVDLRPGTYTVTFTLPGFSVVKREGIELTTGFTAAVNGELAVGSVNETVTVTGASPVVDVQNARIQTVLSSELLDSAPAGRKDYYAFAALTVGVRAQGAQDVGGNQGGVGGAPVYHGLSGGDSKFKLDGMDHNNFNGTGGGPNNYYRPNQMAVGEVNMGLSGQHAENETAGVQINMVPREGGNRFSGTAATTYSNENFASSNLTDEIRARGLTSAPLMKRTWDHGAALGGPVSKDRLWFFAATRWWGSDNQKPGAYYNATQHTRFYTPDLSRPAISMIWTNDFTGRLSWQVNKNHKVTVTDAEQRACFCTYSASPIASPESTVSFWYKTRLTQATWSYPRGNRLLFQGGMSYGWNHIENRPSGDVHPTDIATTDQGTGIRYGAVAATNLAGTLFSNGSQSDPLFGRFSMSYVTGSHALKVGVTALEGWHKWNTFINESISYTFLNRVPISLTQYASPFNEVIRLRARGLYAEDQWTVARLTLHLGARFDYFKGAVREADMPAGRFVPARRFAAVDRVPSFKDINPRLSAAYDLFGNGKTALKGSIGRYVVSLGAGVAEQNNPALRAVNNTTRTWGDANGNYVPDCVLTNLAVNGECGAVSNNLFGTVVPGTTYGDDTLRGWGNRIFTWQSSVAVQHELRSGLSASVGYFRNSFGNPLVSVNQAVTAADFKEFCVTAPQDSRLPGGGGNRICGLYDVNPSKFGQVSTFVDAASNVGAVPTKVFNGVDVALAGRLGRGQLTAGFSMGSTVTDVCALNAMPQAAAVDGQSTSRTTPFCHVAEPWSKSHQIKLNGFHPLPFGFEASAVFQNLPGVARTASLTYRNPQIAPELGRNLSAGPNGTVTVPILQPQTSFEDRLTQVDVRFTKVFRFRSTQRLKASVDVYNLLNASAVGGVNGTFGTQWLNVTSIMGARFATFGAQYDF